MNVSDDIQRPPTLWLTYLLLAPGANEELVVKIREGLD